MPTFSNGFEVGGDIGFAIPCATYRRNLATAAPTIEIGREIDFASLSTHYRRNLATAQPTVLIDVVSAPFLPGDTGTEIVFNIPNRLRIRPHLLAPPNGSQHRLGSPVMIWTETVEAVYYEVHVALDIDFQYRVARLDVLGGQVQHGWPFGGTYYWRVRAVAGSAWSDYSEVWRFTVPSLTPMAVAGHDAEGRDRLLNQFKAGT